MSHLPKLSLLLSIACLSCLDLSAQESERAAGSTTVLDEARQQLDARQRGELFPKTRDRFEIVGLGQADNLFRERAPALQNSDKVSTQVNLTALRLRLLQAYSGESLPPSPVPPVQELASGATISERGKPKQQAAGVLGETGTRRSSPIKWLLGLPLGVLLSIYICRRGFPH